MSLISIGTFNCENFFMRYRFTGPVLKKKKGEKPPEYAKRVELERKKALEEFGTKGGPLEWLARDVENYSAISGTQRKATAEVILQNKPDVMALMEIESMEALRKFNSEKFFGRNTFKYAMLIDGNDPRGIDVGVLSNFPITHVRSYVDDTYATSTGKCVKTFSRDCLVVTVAMGNTPLTLFVNHFKSQLDDNPERRKRQAERVVEILKDTFGEKISTELFAVVGDLNQTPGDPSLAPLLKERWLLDVLTLLSPDDRWTHVYETDNKVIEVGQLDYILLSSALAGRISGKPLVERRGLAKYSGLDKYFPDSTPRILKTVSAPGTEASDHCPVFVKLSV